MRVSRAVRWIENRPEQALAGFLILHVAVWTALPATLYLNLPLDLIEALTYGREWQLGYDKLPPLPWWLVEIAYRTIGRDFAYYLLAQLVVALAFIAVWSASLPLIGPVGALIALLIIDGQHYFSFTAVKFNHDVVQLPFWALAGFAYHRALRGGRLEHWALLGFAIGAALWAKYFVVMLAFPLGLFVFIDRDARRHLATPGPYLAIAIALAVMMPHLVWLWQNDFLPLAYAEARAQPANGMIDHLRHPLRFAFNQLVFVLPTLLIALALFVPRKGRQMAKQATDTNPDSFDVRIMTLLAFGPAATVFALAALSGRGTVAMWGYPLWLFLGTWLVMRARAALDSAGLARIGTAWTVVFIGFAAAFIITYDVLPRRDERYRAVFFPGSDLGREISARFRALTGKPLLFVVAAMWEGGNIAHYAPDHPRVLIDGKPARAPWIDLTQMRASGAVVVWTSGDTNVLPAGFRNVADDAEIQPPFTLPYRLGKGEVVIGWAILRPRAVIAAGASARTAQGTRNSTGISPYS